MLVTVLTDELMLCSQKQPGSRAIKRYRVDKIYEVTYMTVKRQNRPAKMLSAIDLKTDHRYTISLRQSWYDTRCHEGDYLHLIGDFDNMDHCVVDDSDNMLILHPDHLISSTVVADSFTCLRRAVLQDRVKATNTANQYQVYGHILHEVFGGSHETQWMD